MGFEEAASVRRGWLVSKRRRRVFGLACAVVYLAIAGIAAFASRTVDGGNGGSNLGGVPAFFAWLAVKYPSILVDIENEKGSIGRAWQEVDNLYLDMNGIIHPCCHPVGEEQPESEEEMLKNVGKLIDNLVWMAQPKNVLFLAIDGVAPRAKMNQQRTRRFRAAKEREIKHKIECKVRREMEANGVQVPEYKKAWDHNVITPGTAFMEKVDKFIREYVRQRLADAKPKSPWFGLKVIVSDCKVPGEGEHKIMEFVRRERARRSYNPNTRHVIVGEDADLIMLSLATHEPNFGILRVKQAMANQCPICFKYGHRANTCREGQQADGGGGDGKSQSKKRYHLVQVPRLRSFIHGEFQGAMVAATEGGKGGGAQKQLSSSSSSVPGDLERMIDDFVFLCIFVGNDFLPHLPGLEIREGALDLLLREYKKVAASHGYLTRAGEMQVAPAMALLRSIGAVERTILQMREEKFQERERRKQMPCRFFIKGQKSSCRDGERCRYSHDGVTATNAHNKNRAGNRGGGGASKSGGLLAERLESARAASTTKDLRHFIQKMPRTERPRAIKQAFDERVAAELKIMMKAETLMNASTADAAAAGGATTPGSSSRASPWGEELDPMGEGFEERYYGSKFGFVDEKIKERICNEYLTGMGWVLQYYYQTCSSWNWFFPFYHAPLALDMERYLQRESAATASASASRGLLPAEEAAVRRKLANYTKGEPFKPLHQLMAVLPPASGHCLPSSYRALMENDSSIIDFYPDNFQIEPDKHKPEWQWVCFLPFIDKDRLLAAICGLERHFSSDEIERNKEGACEVYVGNGVSNRLGLFSGGSAGKEKYIDLAPAGMGGQIQPLSRSHGLFKYPPLRKHESRLLPGVNLARYAQPMRSTLTSGAAQRLLQALSDKADRKAAAFENVQTHVPRVEHNFAMSQKSIHEREYYGYQRLGNGAARSSSASPFMRMRSPFDGVDLDFGSSGGHGHGHGGQGGGNNNKHSRNKRKFDPRNNRKSRSMW